MSTRTALDSGNPCLVYVGVDVAGITLWFRRESGNADDAKVVKAATQLAIDADRGDMMGRYNERGKQLWHAERRISALKARITKLKRGQK